MTAAVPPDRSPGLSMVELAATLAVVGGLAAWVVPSLIEDGRTANEAAAAVIVDAVGRGDGATPSLVAEELLSLDELPGIIHRCGYDLWIDGSQPKADDVARTIVATPRHLRRSGRHQYRMTRRGEFQRRDAAGGPTAPWTTLE